MAQSTSCLPANFLNKCLAGINLLQRRRATGNFKGQGSKSEKRAHSISFQSNNVDLDVSFKIRWRG